LVAVTTPEFSQHKVLSESELLRAMFDVGFFPPNTPGGTAALTAALSSMGAITGAIK
jgi:hypothetical protein